MMPSTENMPKQYRKKFFAIDDSSRFEGLSASEFWNGWSVPYFTEDVARKIMSEFASDDFPTWYDAERDTYCFQMEPGDSGRVSEFCGFDISVDGKSIHVYGIGAFDWTWDSYNEAELSDVD